MKTNEAPEKVYFSSIENGTHYFTEEMPFEREYTEYTRTDAFIEKACKWFEKNWSCYTYPSSLMFDDFKKYMKGE